MMDWAEEYFLSRARRKVVAGILLYWSMLPLRSGSAAATILICA